MTDHEASRTLVKSPPELWAECSDAASLARHLGQFGEIRITRLEPETAVAWEGEEVSGTVRLEPTGWGTKVILTARRPDADEPPPAAFEAAAWEPEPMPEPVAEPEPEPEPVVESDPEPVAGVPSPDPVRDSADARRSSRRGAFGRLREYFGLGRGTQQASPQQAFPEPQRQAPPQPGPLLRPVQPAQPPPGRPDSAVPAVAESVPAVAEPEPAAGPAPAAEPAPVPDAALMAALDSLGQAHHRPFSRG
jgi:hypothetical protein